jgi:WD40 repeat protein
MSVALRPDGTRAATASEDGTLRVWNLAVRYQLQVRPRRGRGWEGPQLTVGPACRHRELRQSPLPAPHAPPPPTLPPPQEDPKTLLTVPLTQLGLKEGQVFSRMAWGPDGTLAAAHGTHIHFIDTDSGKLLESLHAHDGEVRCLAWAPVEVEVAGGRAAALASCSSDRRVRVWRSPKPASG